MKVKISKEELKRVITPRTDYRGDWCLPDFVEMEGEPILAEEEKCAGCCACIDAEGNHTPKTETPMGVSQWIEHGQKFGYLGYLIPESKP